MPRSRATVALLAWLGTACPAFGAQIQVPAGSSINAGLAAASPGDTVCVQGGTYQEEVVLVPGVVLLGGWDAGFTVRDPATHVSMIHGESVRSCVVSDASATAVNIVDGFTFHGAGGTPGAAIRVQGGSPVFSGNVIDGNRQAGVAGGAYITGGSTARFSDNVFRNNSSAGSGGAVRIESSSPVFEDNLFTGNVARSSGGAFYVYKSTLTATNNTIRDGLAGNGGGAAFFFAECPDGGVVSNTTIEDCKAGHGGAIVVRDESIVTFDGATIRRCEADAVTGGYGGGVFVLGYSSFTMLDARIEDCSATADGGGLYSFRSDLRLEGADAADPLSAFAFVNCSAQGQGGGLWAFASRDTSRNRVDRVRFSDCTSRDEGGGFYFEECSILFSRNVVERCTGSHGGGGTVFTSVTAATPVTVIVNNTFYECSATNDPAGDPGGGLVVAGPSNSRLAYLAGNIISNTLSGACIACTGGAGISQPTIRCSTVHNDPGNTSELFGGTNCRLSFQADNRNAEREPGFCSSSPTDYSLRNCDVEVNCPEAQDITGALLRGATDATCPCNLADVEESTWGQIKARYRR